MKLKLKYDGKFNLMGATVFDRYMSERQRDRVAHDKCWLDTILQADKVAACYCISLP